MDHRTRTGILLLALFAATWTGCATPARAPAPTPAPGPAHVPVPRAPVAVETPAEGPPTPRLDADADVDEDLILARCLRGDELLAELDDRDLSPPQRRQLDIARQFLVEAREALDRGDLGRADVLSEKSLSLIEDVARDP